jgi:lipid-binding SYLF domain-containing protein
VKGTLVAVLTLSSTLLMADERADAFKRIDAAKEVFEEIMSTPDKGVPRDILEHARCLGVIPGLKRAGFIVGAKYGKGILVCRTDAGRWSAPSTVRVEGGSIGLQIGAGETDLVFVVKNKSGEEKLMQDKFTFGGDASAMAGPVGRTAQAQTDAQLHAEILSWSRARGAFAGISLEGSTLRPDNGDNKAVYGKEITQREILSGGVRAPADVKALYTMLHKFTEPEHKKRT